jgi:hypothetical protein
MPPTFYPSVVLAPHSSKLDQFVEILEEWGMTYAYQGNQRHVYLRDCPLTALDELRKCAKVVTVNGGTDPGR